LWLVYASFSQATGNTTASLFRLANNQPDPGVYPYGDGEGAMIPFTRARPGAVESPELS
jgi:hypothetical protein